MAGSCKAPVALRSLAVPASASPAACRLDKQMLSEKRPSNLKLDFSIHILAILSNDPRQKYTDCLTRVQLFPGWNTAAVEAAGSNTA